MRPGAQRRDRAEAPADRSYASGLNALPCAMEWVIVSTIDSGHHEVGRGGEEGSEEAALV